MDASPMPPELVRELEALRRRAYGLDADIEADPVALRRLDELETVMHSRAAALDPPSRADSRPFVAADAPDEMLDPLRHSADRHPFPRLWPVRRILGVIAGILALGWFASVVLIPQADGTLTAARSTAQGRQNLVDHVDLIAIGMLGARLEPFAAYGGLEVWSATNESGVRCLLVGSGDTDFDVACAPLPLEPSLDLRVGDQIRPAAVGELAVGSVIRFVLRNDDVSVWVVQTPSSHR